MKTKKRKSNELPVAHHKATLMEQPDKVWSLSEMERTGGEPDVIGRDEVTGALVFVYHNNAESYYGVRGFRGRLLV